ncbi:aryl-alcohol dehydrogenase-like predicted oxidoreductase [Bradyrhizobium sp. R2.2-H]|jgi:aryl-alcohol dehydrogenase-like predicted oxidoreductase|uniref:aldo/keto reductase n=1 Tax=unclassified Bradyrhizobium TaxID=2631580 RepID=UPI001045F126|nr:MULTISPECIES: aldo/keto reductase [unclassified Bradyrhizobium]TCU76697.1 aryl-alcohol dehydrogenase-like predicted oxidoreductase [Bradyrhizobium sp. Y-H1]TCU79770.1 aryl-alcohol dehydrogenase-like predicted oxidoreductase [Bradyrhizobium sp. R2.2-H]
MRLVRVPKLGRQVSAIGFGCASLGSRISASEGQRAVARALDLGVSWFDVAPPYGDGRAETLLGQCLRGRRDKVAICTKFGIAPPQLSLTARLLRPAARHAIASFPALRRIASGARSTGTRAAIDAEEIERSVMNSLRALGTDYVDVLALHDPTPDEAASDHIFDRLRRLVEKGYVRALSVAGEPASVIAAARSGKPIDIAQFRDTPLSNAAPSLRVLFSAPPLLVTHGAFDADARLAVAGLSDDRARHVSAVARDHGIELPEGAADLLVHFAFANNPDGIVIVSMFRTEHMQRNLAACRATPAPALASALRDALTATHALAGAS